MKTPLQKPVLLVTDALRRELRGESRPRGTVTSLLLISRGSWERGPELWR